MPAFLNILVLIATVLASFSCSLVKIDRNSPTVTAEEYKVFMAVLRESKGRQIVMDGLPSIELVDGLDEELWRKFEGLHPDTKENLSFQNSKPYSIEVGFATQKGFPIIGSIPKIGKAGSLKGEERYKAFYSFSRVGFDQNGTQAIVFYWYYGGPRAAKSSMYFLVNTGGEWRVNKEVVLALA